ncbi:MAG: autotransporter domain-containing protein [Puniceicoccales bacterium]|jgi:uncharacterized protein YhjY with autotransporter beta-barrel domain/subtilisin family serine protease|nr:autotransporter domain-containing protein [Puniceicoccales bacterium]
MSRLPLSLLVASAALLSNEALGATYGASFYPNDPFFFYSSAELPNFAGQWHLDNLAPDVVGTMTGNAHLDVNVKGAWGNGVTGAGVVIGIIDMGVEGDHEDLAANYIAALSKNFSQNAQIAEMPQGPIQPDDNHGVAVAGVAAARGGNRIGVSGVAPYAGLAGQRIRLGESIGSDVAVTQQDQVDAFLWQSGVDANGAYLGEAAIHIKNNSWGRSLPFYDEGMDGTGGNVLEKDAPHLKAISLASANNVIFVFAAGNDREIPAYPAAGNAAQQAQTHGVGQFEPVINVAALGSDGIFCEYSNFGSSILVTVPSGPVVKPNFGITTTDRMGSAYGYNTFVEDTTTGNATLTDLPNANYTAHFNGTSSAAPLVSGILALGKQVAPAMDVRLAKHAFVRTSRIVDAEDNSLAADGGRGWVRNAAGFSFNANYGFGLVDATAFVNKVIESAYITDRTTVSVSETVGEPLPTATATSGTVTKTFVIPESFASQPIETVEVGIKMTGDNTWKDLHITLTSPSETTADVLLFSNTLAGQVLEADYNEIIPGFDWIFTVNNFWGEDTVGEWDLSVQKRGTAAITWDSYNITFNMGRLVLESEADRLNITDGVIVKAHSLNLDNIGTVFTVQEGGTFTVTDSVNIAGGTAHIYGVLNEGTPTVNPEFSKGNKVTIGETGRLTVWEGGSLTALRGVEVNGGTFTNKGEIAVGLITVNAGLFESSKAIAIPGALTVNAGEFLIKTGNAETPAGELTATGGITVNGGSIYVPTTIFTSTAAVAGGALQTRSLNAEGITLSGGSISTNTIDSTGVVAVSGGVLSTTGAIVAPSVEISGGWYSPGGFGRVSTTATVDGAFVLSRDAMFVIDARGVRQADNSILTTCDLLTVTGAVHLGGYLYVNRLTDNAEVASNIRVGDELVFLASNTDITGEINDTLYATISPTLHFGVQIRDRLDENEQRIGKEAYGIAVRDYAYISLTPNQRAVANTFNTLLRDVYPTEDDDGGLGPLPPITPGPINNFTSADQINEEIDETYKADGNYEAIFTAIDSISTDNQLRELYDHLAPINTLILGQTLRKQGRSQVDAAKRRSREARSSFIQVGALWTNSLFGDAFGFNYATPLVASAPGGFVPFEGFDGERPLTLWLNGGGAFTPGRGNEITSGYDTYSYNATVGADYRFSDVFLVGVLIGYGGTRTDFNTGGVKNESDSFAAGLYTAGHARGWFYSGALSVSSDSHSLKRGVSSSTISQLNGRYKGSPDGSTFAASFETGYEWRAYGSKGADWSFGPVFGVQYLSSSIDAYTENGSTTDSEPWQRLSVGKQDIESFTTSAGFQISRLVNLDSLTLLPELRVSWIHEFNDDTPNITARMNIPGVRQFSVQGIKPTQDYTNVALGVSLSLSERASLTATYDCYLFIKNEDPTHSISATLRFSF